MNALTMIETLKQTYIKDNFHFDFSCSMLLSGDRNKSLRQSIVQELTGEKLPASKCGLHAVTDILMEEFKQLPTE